MIRYRFAESKHPDVLHWWRPISYPKQSDTKTYVSQEAVGKIFAENELLIAWAAALAMRDKFQLVLMVKNVPFACDFLKFKRSGVKSQMFGRRRKPPHD